MIQSFHVMDEPSHLYSIISSMSKDGTAQKIVLVGLAKLCPALPNSNCHVFWAHGAQNNKKPIKDFLAVLSTSGFKHNCSSNQGNIIPLVNSSGTLPPKQTAKALETWWPKKTSLSFWSKMPKSAPNKLSKRSGDPQTKKVQTTLSGSLWEHYIRI